VHFAAPWEPLFPCFNKGFFIRDILLKWRVKLKFSQKMLHPSKIGTSFEKDPIYILKFLEFGKIHPQNPLDNRVICKVTLSTFTPPYPLFQRYPQSKEILLNISMKCWNSAFNAQGSRVIIVVVQVGAVKIYVAAVEAFGIKERQDETQFITKIDGKTILGPSYFVL
jgi:hypothetical protein